MSDRELLGDAERALVALTDECAGSCAWDGDGCACAAWFWPTIRRIRELSAPDPASSDGPSG